jgi:transposase-like protein
VDWKKLKAEYIAGGTSYRKLAEKHNVSFHTLRKQAAKENWKALRDETTAKTVTKIIEIESDKQAERMKRLLTVSDKLLACVEDAVEQFQAGELMLEKGALKSLSGTIKDIKDIQSLKTELDIEEQKARIAILKKQAEANNADDDKPHGVVLMPPIMADLTPPKEVDNGQ